MAQQLVGLANLLQNMKIPDGVNPLKVDIPKPPALEGPLAPNDWLTKAQPFARNAIYGPESLVVVDGYVYTGLEDGWIVEIRPNGSIRRILRMAYNTCGRQGAPEGACGRPLGIRADRNGYLVVADAYNGIFRINPQTGRFLQLVNARNQLVNGKPLGFINDLAVASDGTIFFSSSSQKWKRSKALNIIFEAENSGRVLVYNPRERVPSRRIQELVTQLNYPDGLELSQDENYLLIAEGARSKIYRAWIGPTSAKFGTIEIFADNLPGFVANIRRSPRNTYWVGMARARHSKLPSVLDIYGDQPNVRGALVALAEKQVIFDEPKYGIVVELDVKGNIIRTLQDPEGSLYTGVSEVAEEKGIVYIASPKKRFVGILNLRTLPGGVSGTTGGALPGDQGAGGTGGTSGGTTGGTSGGTGGTNGGTNGGTGGTNGGTGGNGIINITPGQIDDAAMQRILDNVRNNLRTMSLEQVEQAVLLLVRRLIEVQIEARRAIERASKLEADLQRLQELIGQSGGPGGSETTRTPSTSSTTLPPSGTTFWGSGGGSGAGGTTGRAATTTSVSTTSTPPPGAAVGPDAGGGGILPPGSLGGGTTSSTTTPSTGTTSGSGTTAAPPAGTTAAAASGTTGATPAATTAPVGP